MAIDPTAMSNALRAFKEFRATFNEGEIVDEESGLTVVDLDTAIKAMEIGRELVSIRQVDLNDPNAWRSFEQRDG